MGAGTVLVLVGTVLLAAVSAVVAFQGWPGASASLASPTPSALLADAAAAATADASADASRPAVVVPAVAAPRREAPAAREVADTGAPEAPARPRATGGPAPTRVEAPAQEPAAPTAAADPAPGDREPSSGLAPTTDAVRDVGDRLGGTLGGTVDGVGDGITPISPTLGTTVDDAGTVVDDTVQGVTNSVGVLLDALSGG